MAAVRGGEPLGPTATLREMRRSYGLSQPELAGRMGTDVGAIVRIERGVDLRLSTLRRYVAGLGGDLHIVARLPRQAVVLEHPPASADERQGEST